MIRPTRPNRAGRTEEKNMPTNVLNARNIADAALQKTKALPAAAAANYSDGIDLGQVLGGKIEGLNVVLECPALPALVEAKTVTFTIKDSADNSTFAAIAELATTVVTGGTGGGAAATEVRFRLPPSARRYIRADAAVLTAGGDNTGVSYTISVLV